MKNKAFKLSGWPDLPANYRRIHYRRMLDDLSMRYATVPQLMSSSGASRGQARDLLRELAGRGLLQERQELAVRWQPAAALRRWLSALLSRG